MVAAIVSEFPDFQIEVSDDENFTAPFFLPPASHRFAIPRAPPWRRGVMRKLGIIAAVLVALSFAIYGLYKLAYPTYKYRYRMTVSIEVDGRVKSESSVIEVRLHTQPAIMGVSPTTKTIAGEGVFLDLGNGRNIVAVLASGPAGSHFYYPEYIVPRHFKLSYGNVDLLPKYEALQGSWALAQSDLPTFVTFTDVSDSKSAREILPSDFSRIFGSSAKPPTVEIQMTSELVTRKITSQLPEIIKQLQAEARDAPGVRPGDPFVARLAHLYIGG